MLWTLLACVGAGPTDTSGNDSVVDPGEEGTGAPDPKPYSGGDCPTFDNGTNSFEVAGKTREFILKLPDDPTGAPVWFNWHPLGGTASLGIQWQGLNSLKNDGWIVVAPEALSSQAVTEWAFLDSMDPTSDLTLFDDLIACLDAQYDIDNDRIYTTGFSAGGLWSAYLVLHRSEYLAGSAPLSGGTGQFMSYVTPEHQTPVLLTWGGESDTYNGLSFDDASLQFQADLEADGHWVGTCVHSSGHSFPNEATDYTVQFFDDHIYGDEPVGLDGAEVYPSWCTE
ncbi:MAG TPA: hypothetical protein QGF58_20700 [Myxococcota bacterium]|nr:hypothetical protein [Myxococcota bacterium]